MFTMLLSDTSATPNTTNPTNSWWLWVVLIVFVVIMLVLPTITQKKKMKEYNNMLNALHVGDEVCTVGGIIGRVTRIDRKGDMQTFTMETGSKGNKSTMTFSMNSIGYILHSTAPAVKAEAKEESKETKPAEETSSQQNTAVQAPAEDVKTVENTE